MIGVRAIVWLMSTVSILIAYRWTLTRSRSLATFLAFGIVSRAVLGTGLFVVSAFDLPILKSIQIGGGFWSLAVDAKSYFDTAADAARVGIATINDVSPSPTYVRALAAWLHIAGISPASAILFNLLCYVAIAVIIVAACRSSIASSIALITVTIDPALVLFGTQALKDSFFILAVVLAIVGVRLWCDGLDAAQNHRQRCLAGGLLFLALGIYVVSGIRAYVGIFMLVALIAAFAASLATQESTSGWRLGLASLVVVILMFGVFAKGAGAYFPYYRSLGESMIRNPSAPLRDLDRARTGFVNSGGGTSLEPLPRSAPSRPNEVTTSPDIELTGGDRATRLLRGTAAFFVPIWLLHALSVVSFTGGQGLLFAADIDTVVMDVSLMASLWLLVRRRPSLPMVPLVAFVAVFSVLSVLVLAYVVTNFGTLFRLRLIAVTPVWLLPALVRRHVDQFVGHHENL
jgi:hypothetical protein